MCQDTQKSLSALIAASRTQPWLPFQRMGSGEEAVGRVVGQTGIRSEGNLYGVEVLEQGDNFWGIRFPQQKELEQSPVRVLLKCSACQNCEVTALNEVDLTSQVLCVPKL